MILLLPTITSLFKKPTDPMIRTDLESFTEIEKLPFKSLIVEVLVPLNFTLAPIIV